jgi:protocatechuate 3,4-dioxygenase beta subunit
MPMPLTRRDFLALVPAPIAALALAACGGEDKPAPSSNAPASGSASQGGSNGAAPTATASNATAQSQLQPTPACGDADDPTPAQTEGPFFKPSSPERVSLIESGITGTKLIVEGTVVTKSCKPVARALLDFWQCDDKGNYDNSGFRLRGHQFTDDQGRYRLETIVPAIYTGRTRHIHVKVQAANQPVLTTQLYFPNEPANQRDGIFDRDLVLESYGDASGGKSGSYRFVLNMA